MHPVVLYESEVKLLKRCRQISLGPQRMLSVPLIKYPRTHSSLVETRISLWSLQEAGIKLVTKFKIKDVAALKAELPWEQVRMLKWAFSDAFGLDVFSEIVT